MEYSAQFIDVNQNSNDISSHLCRVDINSFSSRSTIRREVLVCKNNQPVIILGIFAEIDEDGYLLEQCFCDVLCNDKTIAVLYGQHAHLFDIASSEVKSIFLHDYVGYLYPVPDIFAEVLSDTFLVATFSYIFLVDINTGIVWQSKQCAIDGVIINDIRNNIIYGSGEWDPPDGWEPFWLSLSNGNFVKP
ncbi:hypothetical protein [Limnobaculum xujianqingii]|uniref:hypothetical protein n=1 Tax=Limnobaculum xujianqingii TaxID=2738837 RepID=UPI001E370C31|nr:hypothetical protein [Limnobaculum xujianqingii]